MVKCVNCGEIISIHNDVCPYCGAPQKGRRGTDKKPSGMALFKALGIGFLLMFLGMVLGLFALGLLGMLIGSFLGLSLGLSLGTKQYLPNQSRPQKTSSAPLLIFLIVFFVTFILIFSIFSFTLYQPPEKKKHFVEVYVYYDDNWDGVLGWGDSTSSKSAYGNAKFWGNLTDGDFVYISAQKLDDSNKEIRVKIYIDGILKRTSSTDSPYGIASTYITV